MRYLVGRASPPAIPAKPESFQNQKAVPGDEAGFAGWRAGTPALLSINSQPRPRSSKPLPPVLLFLALLLPTASIHADDFQVFESPKALPATSFAGADGQAATLSSFAGKVVVLDFWATWCTPCRAEFPQLDHLQEQLGGRGLVVVPVSLDRKGQPVVDKFYHELSISRLASFLDPQSAAANILGVRGLPTTVIIDRQGREAARIEGPVDWTGPAAQALLNRLLDAG
jgi:thiol-disulfide isomerase/thioredoxin